MKTAEEVLNDLPESVIKNGGCYDLQISRLKGYWKIAYICESKHIILSTSSKILTIAAREILYDIKITK